MKSALVVLGAIFIIAGIGLYVFTFIPVSNSMDWFNQSFVVPEYSHYYVMSGGNFALVDVTSLKISFETTQGGDVDFYIMNEAEYNKFSSGLSFNYIQSAPSVTRMEATWDPPKDVTLYFVWDNTDLFETKSVSAHFQLEFIVAIISPTIAVLGLLLLFGGFSIVSLGLRFPSSDSSRTKIVVGYAFASLGGLIGIFIGADLERKQNLEEKWHGKIITALGVIATIIYISLSFLLFHLANLA